MRERTQTGAQVAHQRCLTLHTGIDSIALILTFAKCTKMLSTVMQKLDTTVIQYLGHFGRELVAHFGRDLTVAEAGGFALVCGEALQKIKLVHATRNTSF